MRQSQFTVRRQLNNLWCVEVPGEEPWRDKTAEQVWTLVEMFLGLAEDVES